MIYIYGGSFDPITEAHLSIIKSIQKILKADDRLVITVANTDETYSMRSSLKIVLNL